MSTRDDGRGRAIKLLAWLLLLGMLTMFGSALRLRRGDDHAVVQKYATPNPAFARAYEASLAAVE